METEPNLLVALLAVRALGGQSVPANNEVVKALKKPVQEAVEKGLLKEDTHTEQIPVEGKKKPKAVKTKVVVLTEEGERVLRSAANPEALAATHTGAVRSQVEALQRSLDADRDALKEQVQAVLKAKGKDNEAAQHEKEAGRLGKEVEKVAKLVQALTERVQQLEGNRLKGGGGAEALTAKIDEGFATLRVKLDQALQALPKPAPATHPAPAAHHPAPATLHSAAPTHHPALAPKPAQPAQEPLQAALRKAYDELKAHFREYQEGMVELPRLYHEVRRARPDLTVADFHRELLTLETNRVIDLHIRNEVRDAPEPDKAIRRNDKLYYFVYWPRS